MKKREYNISVHYPEARELLMQIFGTDNKDKLKKIAENAKKYDQLFLNAQPVNIRGAGRKSIFTDKDISKITHMHENGRSIQEIAVHFNTTRQTISKYIASSKRTRKNHFITMRMEYMYENELCTTIDIDFKNRKIYILNHTNDIIHRAFGVVTNPTWDDFEQFLERRCFPKTRANIKSILRDIDVPNYDPLQIIEKTEGRMAEDNQWIKISYPQRGNHYGVY